MKDQPNRQFDLFALDQNTILLIKLLIGKRFLAGELPEQGVIEMGAMHIGEKLDALTATLERQTRAIQDLTTQLHEQADDKRGHHMDLQRVLEEIATYLHELKEREPCQEEKNPEKLIKSNTRASK